MKKFYFLLLSLFYFGCSSEPEADYISEELLVAVDHQTQQMI